MDSQLFRSWRKYVHNLGDALGALQERTIIAVGVAPYPRIIPAIFLDRSYQIYCTMNSADIETLRQYATIFCLEEKNPKVAAKVNSTGYLIKNYMFQAFLKSRRDPFELLFYQTTPPIVDYLNEREIPWIGNDPKTFEPVLHKEGFRKVLKKLKFERLPELTIKVADFFTKNYDEFYKHWQKPVVIQPGDYEIHGSTYFIRSQEDLVRAQAEFRTERFERVHTVKLTPFIEGDALSMLGCVTEQGVLTGPLQLQFVDVPEYLHGYEPTGEFCGHDWGFQIWSESAELDAQVPVELLGKWLYERGYRGIFGIDFIYDRKKDQVYPLECNPRYTGTIPVYSLINLVNGVPPIDFFTIASYKRVPMDFDYEAVNTAWKKRKNVSHIALTPRGIGKMRLPLAAGIYRYDRSEKSLQYLRPGAFLHEIKNPDEFIIIDQPPLVGQEVIEAVPRLFKLIFPASIGLGTKQIKPEYGEIITALSQALRKEA